MTIIKGITRLLLSPFITVYVNTTSDYNLKKALRESNKNKLLIVLVYMKTFYLKPIFIENPREHFSQIQN